MDAKNYFEENKAKFADKSCSIDIDTRIFGVLKATLTNDHSGREADIDICIVDADSEEHQVEVSPEEAYWFGKCLIDFAENAVNLNNYYNQNNKADE